LRCLCSSLALMAPSLETSGRHGLVDHVLARIPLASQPLLVSEHFKAQRPTLGVVEERAHFREKVFLLLLVVMLDLLLQHLELGLECALRRRERDQVRQQPLERQMLFQRFQQDVLSPARLDGGVENQFLRGQVRRELIPRPREPPSTDVSSAASSTSPSSASNARC